MINFIIGVASSIIATILIALALLGRSKFADAYRMRRKELNIAKRMYAAGLSNFFASRGDYARYRNAPRLIDYLDKASSRILISAYWMAQGAEMEGVVDGLEALIREPRRISITIVVIDPTASYVDALAQHLNVGQEYLVSRARGTLFTLHELYGRLSESEKERLVIRVHRTVPMASLIALDPDLPSGRLQIDIKPYKVARQSSVSFEFSGPGRALYETLKASTEKLVFDSLPFEPARHLAGS